MNNYECEKLILSKNKAGFAVFITYVLQNNQFIKKPIRH